MPSPGVGQASALLSSCSAAIAVVGVIAATAVASYLVGKHHGRLQQQQQEEDEDSRHCNVDALDGNNNDKSVELLDKQVNEIKQQQQQLQQRISSRAESRIFFRSLSNNHHEENKEGSSSNAVITANNKSSNNEKDEMTLRIENNDKQHDNNNNNNDDDDDDEVCIVEIVSPMECISRAKSAAEIKNEIIVISDDDDDDYDDVETVTQGVKIKMEPNNNNANVPSTMNNNMTNTNNNNSAHYPTSSLSINLPPIQPIATLSSVYRLCVGTPRQGMLVPHSRGIITFDTNIVSRDSIIELEGYSHVYVLFAFHLNNNLSSSSHNDNHSNRSNNNKTRKQQQQQFPSKIAPPSLGGKKVGIFATRTPHRPNPIGISLCKLDRVIIHQDSHGGTNVTQGKKSNKFNKNKNNNNHNNNNSSFSLLLSGLDLVDGTPILDIKPYVPHYDCVGYVNQQLHNSATSNAMPITNGNDMDDSTLIVNNNSILHNPSLSLSPTIGKEGRGGRDNDSAVKVPNWVESGLQKRRNVTLLPKAKQFLHQYQDLMSSSVTIDGSSSSSTINDETPLLLQQQQQQHRLQFYGPHTLWNDTHQYAIQCLEHCIIDTLSSDVRSAWQTDKARRGKFQAERSVRLGGGGPQRQQQQQCDSEGDDNNTNSNVDNNNDDDDQPQRLCTQQIDNVLVSYTIGKSDQHIDECSEGSGAEDVVVVHTISFIEYK
jgi:tRNA (Thr-GGU) A37 N-methylase